MTLRIGVVLCAGNSRLPGAVNAVRIVPPMAKTPENKTKPNAASVSAFINGIADDAQRKDAKALLAMMKRVTGSKPKMWGSAIVGFGTYHYKYATGREGDWLATGFSPRTGANTIYVMVGLEAQKANLAKLGRHSLGRSCIYFKRLSDLHIPALEAIVKQGLRDLRKFSPDVRL